MSRWIAKIPVASHSNPDLAYVVGIAADGGYGCSCPAWTKGKHAREDCKHILQVKAEQQSSHKLMQAKQAGVSAANSILARAKSRVGPRPAPVVASTPRDPTAVHPTISLTSRPRRMIQLEDD